MPALACDPAPTPPGPDPVTDTVPVTLTEPAAVSEPDPVSEPAAVSEPAPVSEPAADPAIEPVPQSDLADPPLPGQVV